MKRLPILFLCLICCTSPTEEDIKPKYSIGCVVYKGFDQRWFKNLKELEPGKIEVTDFDGKKSIITNYDSYECQ